MARIEREHRDPKTKARIYQAGDISDMDLPVNVNDPTFPLVDAGQAYRDKVHPFAAVMSGEGFTDRATFHVNYGYQPAGGNAVGGTIVGQRLMEATGEQPFDRPSLVVPEGQSFPLLAQTYLTNPGVVVVENLTGEGRQRRASPEEQAADFAVEVHVVRVGQETPLAVIRRGVPFIAEVPNPQDVYLIPIGGAAKIHVVVLPR